MSHHDKSESASAELREWLNVNVALLKQAADITIQFLDDAVAFSAAAGPHIRHIMEHVDALMCGLETGVVHYDRRAHDRAPEVDPHFALKRLSTLIDALQKAESSDADMPLQLGFVTGLDGNGYGRCRSTLARELHFLASHGIHHFAVLKRDLDQLGIVMPMNFGVAPETIRHLKACSV